MTTPPKVPLKPQEFLSKEFFDQYTVHPEVLGQGSFGTVYKITDKKTNKDLALKLMSYAQLGKNIDAVKGEIEAMQALPPHPRLLTLHTVAYSSTGVGMILDLVRGGELFKHLLRMKHYSERTAALIIRNLCQAISHMHQYGIVHRDLKPDNMLLINETSDADRELSSIVVSDFGFAVPYRGAKLTQPCGTPYYLAPEILDVGLFKTRAGYDEKCDVWSIGVICYVLLVGYPPFNGADKNKLFKAIDGAKPDFSNKVWANISTTATDFIKYALKRNSAERPSAKELLSHPWIQSVSSVPDLHLSDSQDELAKFASQRLKGAFFGVEAALRLQYLANCQKFSVRSNTAVLEMLSAATQPVETLNMRGNYLGAKGMEALINALVENGHVKTLILINTLIEDETAEKLLDRLTHEKSSIKYLLLDENPVTHSIGRRVLQILQKGTTPLKYVSLSRTHVSDALQRKIKEICGADVPADAGAEARAAVAASAAAQQSKAAVAAATAASAAVKK